MYSFVVTYDEVKFISYLASIVGAMCGVFLVKRIEKRLGCKDDWELIALVGRKISSLWQKNLVQK
jgi:hypothetical protein